MSRMQPARWPVQLSVVVSEHLSERIKALNNDLKHDSLGDTLRLILSVGVVQVENLIDDTGVEAVRAFGESE